MKYFVPNMNSPMDSQISQILAEVAKNTEESILSQLNDFISRGLISVERTSPLLVQSQHSTQLELKYSVHLRLKDAEYIESLERQNKELQDLIHKLRTKDSEKESSK